MPVGDAWTCVELADLLARADALSAQATDAIGSDLVERILTYDEVTLTADDVALAARVVVAIPWIVFAIAIVGAGGLVFTLAMVALAILGLREFFLMARPEQPIMLPGYAVAAGMVIAAHYGSAFQILLVFAALFPLAFAFAAVRRSHEAITISIAFILLAMAKERTELRHRTAAMVDPLTGIANRRSFLQDAALAAKRHIGNPRPVAVLLIDIDRFKSINDSFGHAVGDRVLAMFAEAARKSMRGSDLMGRFGGDEFAAMLVETNREKAIEVAERIRATFAQMTQDVDGHQVGATVSIGLVHCLERTLDIPELLTQADHALYCAKERGRNRVEVASLDMLLERREQGTARGLGAAAIGAKSAA